MRSILIDAGNSAKCKVAVCHRDTILRIERVWIDHLLEAVRNIVAQMQDSRVDVICMASVVGEVSGLERGLKELCRRFIKVQGTMDLPIGLQYSTPQTLGADRIAAAVGAYSLFPGEECLIVDMGSAITIDYLTQDGVFLGGNISPGLQMRLRALHDYTGALPEVNPYSPEGIYGQNTEEAINNGTILGILFEVENYMRLNKGCRVIFTGGDALFFAKKLKSTIFVVCNLVLLGLLKIAQSDV